MKPLEVLLREYKVLEAAEVLINKQIESSSKKEYRDALKELEEQKVTSMNRILKRIKQGEPIVLRSI